MLSCSFILEKQDITAARPDLVIKHEEVTTGFQTHSRLCFKLDTHCNMNIFRENEAFYVSE